MAANPQIWGDWPIWSAYPLWSTGVTAALPLGRLTLTATTERKIAEEIQASLVLSVRLSAVIQKRIKAEVQAATSLTILSSAVTQRRIRAYIQGSTTLTVQTSARTQRRVSIQGSTALEAYLGAYSHKIGYQSAGPLALALGTAADMAALVAAQTSLRLTQTADVWPIVYLWGRSALVMSPPIVAETERLGPVRKQSFWGGGYRSVIYQTALRVPGEAVGATLKLIPHLEEGTISRIEYGYGRLGPMWAENEGFWGDDSFWGYPPFPREWLLWGEGLQVHAGEYIMVRVHTSPRQAARLCELEWIFDVEDARLALNDVQIPAEGIRVNVPRHYFRWISVINFGTQYDSGKAVATAWVDKGIIDDGGVVEGPFIVCLDKDGELVAGNTDIILQGARGKNYVDVAE